jgi:hypothetical protein
MYRNRHDLSNTCSNNNESISLTLFLLVRSVCACTVLGLTNRKGRGEEDANR